MTDKTAGKFIKLFETTTIAQQTIIQIYDLVQSGVNIKFSIIITIIIIVIIIVIVQNLTTSKSCIKAVAMFRLSLSYIHAT